MKRIILGITSFIFLLGVASCVGAQTFDYNRAYQDYVFNLSLYQKAHTDYQLARAAYLQSQTSGTTEDAVKATRTMLETRDNVVMTYLTALRMKLLETKGVSDSEKSGYFTQIDTEVAWWASHRDRLGSAGSLNDLVSDSDEAKEHFGGTKILMYQTLIEIGVSETTYQRTAMKSVIDLLNQKIAEIRLNGDKDTTSIERFLVEVGNKLSRSEVKEGEAKSIVSSIKSITQDSSGSFQNAVSDVEDSLLYLKEANKNLKEVVTQIKTN